MLIIIGFFNALLCNVIMFKELENDYDDIQKGIPDKHNNDVLHRFILIPLVSVVTATVRDTLWGDSFWESYIICLYLGAIGYVFFDYLLNLIRGKSWDYLGK